MKLKKCHLLGIGLVFLITTIGVFMTFNFSEVQATITNGANAVNVIGQLEGGVPVYTTNAANNGEAGAVNSGFDRPDYVEIDTTNNRLFVSDRGNNRILIFNLNASNQLIDYEADNVLGQADFSSSDSGRTATTLYYPAGLAFDNVNDRLFVSDSLNHRVLVFDLTTISNGEAAVNVLGPSDFTSANANCDNSGIGQPTELAYDSTNQYLYVSASAAHRILVFDVTTITDGEAAINVLGQSVFDSCSSGTTQSTLKSPNGLAIDTANNRLFVGDSGNKRVLVFDVETITDGENAANVLGQADFTSAVNIANQNTIKTSLSVDYDGDDNRLFVGDRNSGRIVVFDVASIENGEDAVNVLGQSTFRDTGSATTQAGFNYPVGLVYNSSTDRLFVADSSNYRVMVFDAGFVNMAPTAATPVFSSQASDTKYVTFTVEVNDTEREALKVQVEYSDDGGSNWYDPDLVSVSSDIEDNSPDLDDSETYQIGTNTAVSTAWGANTLTVVWNPTSSSNGNGAITDRQTDIKVRVTANDATDDGTVSASAAFTIDNSIFRTVNPETCGGCLLELAEPIQEEIVTEDLTKDSQPLIDLIGKTTVTANITRGIKIYLTMAIGSHTLTVTSIDLTGQSVDLEVESEPIHFTMKEKETRQVDLNNDAVNDFELYLSEIVSSNKIELMITKLEQPEQPEELEEAPAFTYIPQKPENKDIEKEEVALKVFIDLVGYLPRENEDWQSIYFLAYGNVEKTEQMRSWERSGLLKDYYEIYGHLPGNERMWWDLAEMAEGTRPTSIDREEIKAVLVFNKVYQRLVDFSNSAEERFVSMTAYRLRPEERNLTQEQQALKTFTKVYDFLPADGFFWSVLRAIAYSGVK